MSDADIEVSVDEAEQQQETQGEPESTQDEQAGKAQTGKGKKGGKRAAASRPGSVKAGTVAGFLQTELTVRIAPAWQHCLVMCSNSGIHVLLHVQYCNNINAACTCIHYHFAVILPSDACVTQGLTAPQLVVRLCLSHWYFYITQVHLCNQL